MPTKKHAKSKHPLIRHVPVNAIIISILVVVSIVQSLILVNLQEQIQSAYTYLFESRLHTGYKPLQASEDSKSITVPELRVSAPFNADVLSQVKAQVSMGDSETGGSVTFASNGLIASYRLENCLHEYRADIFVNQQAYEEGQDSAAEFTKKLKDGRVVQVAEPNDCKRIPGSISKESLRTFLSNLESY